MSTIKKIFFTSLPLLFSYLSSYLFVIIIALIYTLFSYSNLDNFITSILPWFLLLLYLFIIIFFKKNYPQQESNLKHYFPQVYLGISLATFLNMLIFKLNLNSVTTSTISLPLAIISTGIIGPLLEEFLFRYYFYNQLKSFLVPTKALLLTSLIFALIHLNPIKIIYAFILGLFLNLSYQKDQNLLSPILIHISANIIVLLLKEYNTYIFFLSLINIFISIKLNFFSKSKNISLLNH